MNAKASNGSRPLGGQPIKPVRALNVATPAPRSSASSTSPQLPRFCDRAVSRHERWEQDCDLDAACELRARQQQEQASYLRCRLMGHLVCGLFMVLALGMATTALHREQQLAPQERQALEAMR